MIINIKRYMDDGYGNTHLVDEILNKYSEEGLSFHDRKK